jgi:hypothetical protein
MGQIITLGELPMNKLTTPLILREAIGAVEENNRITNTRWSDWDNARDIIEAYELEASTELEDILSIAISNNGGSIYEDYRRVEKRDYGQNFSDFASALFKLIPTFNK